MKRYQKGFTLIELVTVLLSLAVMAGGLILFVLAILWLAKELF